MAFRLYNIISGYNKYIIAMKKILFCGGGSAGHVIPNISIIESLNKIAEPVYLGTGGIEKGICRDNKVMFYEYQAPKLVRGKIFCNITLPFKLLKSIKQAGEIIDKIKPDLVFCKGGYVCVPPAIAAKKRGIPVITHESDVSVGLANKIIAKRCKKVLTSFPQTARSFENGIYTGTPMRATLFNRDKAEARAKFGLDMRPTLIVLGGGSGSVKINEAVRKSAHTICKDFNILHLCGKGNTVNTNIYGYKQVEFENDMGLVYACADGAISRCGSNTANELAALKIPTLFIPLENKRSRGDQVKNAEYFQSLGICDVLREADLTEQSLVKGVYNLMQNDKIKTALKYNKVECGNEKIIREILATLRQPT